MMEFTDLTIAVVTIMCCWQQVELLEDLKLPEEHVPYYFTNNKPIRKLCEQDELCPYKVWHD